ncbi:DUF1002 domain-containing protein [Aquibacillus sp. 3ASR75-11]|uniref:DUF1002 domain-containing protein n=1 Tax=Terrihalobacillus insolitus TaxID=2950438 RepID=A0A9X3WTP3_9BACI|nr:DUF1002 domain-containing protein [Terrihalobacillus insolitus]MDC3424443.1 DUF1002 domain-containing protein [Terrihalobacillus insolitus]
MKRCILFISMLLVLTFQFENSAFADSDDATAPSVNEKFGVPIVVYGETLTTEQKNQVRKLLEVDDPEAVEEITVTAEDLVKYIEGSNPNSRMFSSAKIVRKEQGEGLVINIISADNITEVTSEMYANALITAGVENALVEVASPVKVSGHSALTGIYKAYEVSGETLNKDRMEVANEELNIATKLADQAGLDKEKASELLTEIKKAIAKQNPATREEVEKIVTEQLQGLNISLNEQDKKLLIDLFDKIRSLDINFDNVGQQLEDITVDIKNKIDKVIDNKGFWQGVADFVNNVVSFLKGLF